MSKRISVNGTTYVVPDDATDDEITEIVDGQSKPATQTAPAQPTTLHELATRPSVFSHTNPLRYFDEIGQGMAQGAEMIGHPIDTASRFYRAVTQPAPHDPSGDEPLLEGLGDVADTIAQGYGQGATAAGVGKVTGKVLPTRAGVGRVLSNADIIDPDITGIVSPRIAHLQRIAIKAGNVLSAPKAASPTLPEVSPAAQQLQSRIQIERGLQAQPPFPRISEGLPEVEAGQAAATAHLQNAVQPQPALPPARIALTPRRFPGEIAREMVRPRAVSPYSPAEPIPQHEPPLALPGKVTDIRPSRIGSLLNEATGGKPLQPKVPLRNQLDVTPKESSVVKSQSYDPTKRELTVETMNGGKYIHGDVSQDQASALENSDSKGAAWNDIKKNSTLVAKVVNGKRVPIKPTSSRTYDPNDLTPILQESLSRVKSKK